MYLNKEVTSYIANLQKYPEPIGSLASCLSLLVDSMFARSQWITPYSYAHFADISQGSDISLRDRDVEFLKQYSGGYWIHEEGDGIKIDQMHAVEHYNWWNSNRRAVR